ncbi:MAG: hypothetical protein WAL95_03095 [Candidatus Acidiferrales bacterium]
MSATKKKQYSGVGNHVKPLGATPDILDTKKNIVIIVELNDVEICRSPKRRLVTTTVDREDIARALAEYAQQIRRGPASDE